MKLLVKPELKIEDGAHQGTIKAVTYRTEPYEYTDFTIEFGEGHTLKAGYPTNVMPSSKLGLLLSKFGYDVVPGKEVEPEWLIGQKCKFVTTRDGKYSNIVPGSVGPVD